MGSLFPTVVSFSKGKEIDADWPKATFDLSARRIHGIYGIKKGQKIVIYLKLFYCNENY